MAFNWKTKMAKSTDEADMSMEEILTSIRRYVTSEQPVSRERLASGKESEASDKNSDIIELTEPLEDIPQRPRRQTQTQPAPVHSTETEPSAYHPPHLREPLSEPLASHHTVSTSTQAFSKLADVAQHQSARGEVISSLTLDQVIMDVTKPLIKEWIDKHLSALVEGMVAKEIERITRGGRS